MGVLHKKLTSDEPGLLEYQSSTPDDKCALIFRKIGLKLTSHAWVKHESFYEYKSRVVSDILSILTQDSVVL
jgi:hypothetical protein